jgi:hypothetical protein
MPGDEHLTVIRLETQFLDAVHTGLSRTGETPIREARGVERACRLRAEVICRMIVLPPGCDTWRARPDGRRHELYLSPRGQMRIGQPNVDRADAEDRDHHGLFDAVRHAVIMDGPRGSLDITACRHRHYPA